MAKNTVLQRTKSFQKVARVRLLNCVNKVKERGRILANPLTEYEECILWKKGVLSDTNSQSLNYALFFTFSQYFGTRGRQEHHQIRVEDLKFVTNAVTGKIDYVEWVEGITKTRQGGLVKKERRTPPQAYATGGVKCPVHLLQTALDHRPASCKTSGPLYLTPIRTFSHKEDVWYTTMPVGINTINTYMQAIAKAGGLEQRGKRLTNHSVRKTTIRKLKRHGVTNTNIVAITGHRNEQSLQEYAEMENTEHFQISKILSGEQQMHCQPLQTIPVQHTAATAVPQYNFSNSQSTSVMYKTKI